MINGSATVTGPGEAIRAGGRSSVEGREGLFWAQEIAFERGLSHVQSDLCSVIHIFSAHTQ